MNFKIILMLFFIFNHQSYALECLGNKIEALDKNNVTLVNCDAAKIALASDKAGEKDYKRNLNKKFAESIALQSKQILEDLGANSNFYEQDDSSFMLSPELGEQCKFEFLKEIENKGCDLKKITDEEKEKIQLLTNALGKFGNDTHSLFGNVAGIYRESKYGANPKGNSCPLTNSDFSLNSIMTASRISFIINLLQKNISDEFKLQYDLYPQMGMILEANKVDPQFQSRFESYLKAFNPKIDAPKSYFMSFFKQEKNKEVLGAGVAQRCRQMQSSISSFICHDVKSPASKDPAVSKLLFNGYNPKKAYQDQKTEVKNDPNSFKTYAYLCSEQQNNEIAEAGALKFDPDKNCGDIKSAPFNNVDHWYNCFKHGVRSENDKSISMDRVGEFCSRYNCQSSDVKDLPSCMAGGPISSQDLIAIAKNKDNLLVQAEYIMQLEKMAKQKESIIHQASTTSGPEVIKKNLSSFDLSAFGADAVSKFLDLPESPKVMSLVINEMKEKGIEPQTHEQIQKIVNREDRPTEVPNFSQPTQLASNEIVAPPMQQTSQDSYSHDLRNSYNNFTTPQVEKNTKDEPAIREPLPPSTNAETEQLKKDLQALMNNRPAKDEDTAVEKADKSDNRKNDFAGRSYADELRDWSSELRRKEGQLSSREIEQWNRDRELDYRQREIDRRERDLFDRFSEPKAETKAKPAAVATATLPGDKKISSNSPEARLQKEREELQVKNNGLTVSPEKLEVLDKKDLTDLGVNIEEPFIIRVVLKGKSIPVRVSKMKKSNGKTYLAPFLNEDSKEIKEAILKSPIFKEFRYYLDQHLSPYSPLKKGKN